MAKNKTIPNKNDVAIFLNNIIDEQKRKDAFELLNIMKEITNEEPKMWGTSIVGFGEYHYRYESGREGDMFLSGFSPRKQNITIYIVSGLERYDAIFGKSCFYVKKLNDIDNKLLAEMIIDSVSRIKQKYT